MSIDPIEQKALRRLLVSRLTEPMGQHGFNLKNGKDSFIRRDDGRTDVFQLVFLDNKIDNKSGWRIQLSIGVRVEVIEEIFHRTSGFAPKYRGDTVTIGDFAGNLLFGDDEKLEFPLNSLDDIDPVASRLVAVFYDFALFYFDKFKSIAEIDDELNSNPHEKNQNRVVPWLRCSTGAIAAKLTGRPNYREVIEIYTERMRISDKGFYLKRFEALLESLDDKTMHDLV